MLYDAKVDITLSGADNSMHGFDYGAKEITGETIRQIADCFGLDSGPTKNFLGKKIFLGDIDLKIENVFVDYGRIINVEKILAKIEYGILHLKIYESNKNGDKWEMDYSYNGAFSVNWI